LTHLFLYNNQLSGCYPESLTNMCGQLSSNYSTNTFISDGNNFDAPWEDFCNTGAGTCSPSSCRQSDSLSLVALYNSTNGANWTNTWNLNSPLDSWFGVKLNETGCVILLDLDGVEDFDSGVSPGNNLVGTMPEKIGELTNITYLNLDNNELSGSLPQSILNLVNLTNLELTKNQLSGELLNFNLPKLRR